MTADRSRVGVRAYVDSLKRLFGGFFGNGSIGELWSWLLGHNPIMQFFMALFVGIVAGIGAVAFRRLIAFFHNLFFFGRISFAYNSLEHTATSVWGPFIILAPALGGLCVAWMIQKFAPEAKGHGVPEVMDAIYYKRGLMRPQVVLIKAVASALNIGSGGSVGREGPIIQMGAAFAANLASWLRLEEWQRYALIAAGAGGGIAATFNTPIGGVLFAVELMLPEISARTLVPVMIATGTATYISRIFLGHHPSFIIPTLHIAATAQTSPTAFAAYLLLGIVIGLTAWVFMRSIYLFEDIFNAVPGNYYTRHVLGMLLVGVTIYLLERFTGHYYVEGVGYAAVQQVLTGHLLLPGLLLILALLKLMVTALTLGSGGSGGIFSPSLFIGATVGGAFVVLAHLLFPALSLNITTAAALGMAGMVGAGTGAALTGAVMIFEMTGDYNIMIPLIVVVSVSYGVRRLITPDTIYTIKLIRRGHSIPESRQSNLYLSLQAASFIRIPFVRLSADADWSSLLNRRKFRQQAHVLIEDGGHIVGVIPAEKLAAHRRGGAGVGALAGEVRRDLCLIDDQSLLVDLLAKMRDGGCEIFVLSRNKSADPADVTDILTWNDIVREACLPAELHPTVVSKTT